MTTQIRERRAVEATTTGKSGRLKIGLISSGWGSSGYYSDKVLENAAAKKVFPAGTHMYFDHPSESEMYDRPERSVRDLAAVLETDGVWDPELKTIVGEAQVFGPYVELLTDEHFAKAIGTSIIASAEVTTGEAEGRQGKIITELIEGKSVDFVTHAGRGGSVLAIMESRRPERVVARAVAHGVAEATANETQDQLSKTVRAAYGADRTYAWVRDFDDTTVWFTVEDESSTALYQQAYSLDANERATLEGDPVEVRATTVYVPVTTKAQEGAPTTVPAPAGRTTHNPESEEDHMGTIQVDEAEHGRVTEAAGRVPQLENQLAESNRERDSFRDERDQLRREAAANRIIDGANGTFTALERRGLLAGLPVTEAGELNEEEFTTAVETALAERAAAEGAGNPSGFGRTDGPGGVSEADFDAALPSAKTKEG